jgi:predicted ATP-dependent endonuclease of OLD family
LYSYPIELHLEERITAIIGPNGRGKTVCLRLIEALFKQRYDYFVSVPFETLQFSFTDGGHIIIERQLSEEDTESEDNAAEESPPAFKYVSPGGEEITWTPGLVTPEVRRQLARLSPFRYAGRDVWIDPTDGEEITTSQLVRRFRGRINPSLRQMLTNPEPEEVQKLLRSVDCQLIETQRLLVLRTPRVHAEFVSDYDEDEYVPPFPRRVRQIGSRLAIQEKAEKLREIFKSTLTEYATLSQSLDRTFPRRVIAQPSATPMTQSALRVALEQVDARRNELMSAGILDRDFEPVSIVGEDIEPGVAKVLEVYVKDANQKLAVFDALNAKVALFKELIETRFLDKTLESDRENGFKVISPKGNAIPLETLSSGEQHQLILVFDLLFEVKENSLILIDEPELSLHVSWQKSFIDSLKRMIALNGFDVVIATHSPTLVARHFDLTVELGAVDE